MKFSRGNVTSECEEGYMGPLCQTCTIVGENIYSKGGGKQCNPCYSKEKVILIISFGGGIVGIIFFFFIKFHWNCY